MKKKRHIIKKNKKTKTEMLKPGTMWASSHPGDYVYDEKRHIIQKNKKTETEMLKPGTMWASSPTECHIEINTQSIKGE